MRKLGVKICTSGLLPTISIVSVVLIMRMLMKFVSQRDSIQLLWKKSQWEQVATMCQRSHGFLTEPVRISRTHLKQHYYH